MILDRTRLGCPNKRRPIGPRSWASSRIGLMRSKLRQGAARCGVNNKGGVCPPERPHHEDQRIARVSVVLPQLRPGVAPRAGGLRSRGVPPWNSPRSARRASRARPAPGRPRFPRPAGRHVVLVRRRASPLPGAHSYATPQHVRPRSVDRSTSSVAAARRSGRSPHRDAEVAFRRSVGTPRVFTAFRSA